MASCVSSVWRNTLTMRWSRVDCSCWADDDDDDDDVASMTSHDEPLLQHRTTGGASSDPADNEWRNCVGHNRSISHDACTAACSADTRTFAQATAVHHLFFTWQGVKVDWRSYGYTSHPTQNRSFRRRSSQSQPIARLGSEEAKPNATKASNTRIKLHAWQSPAWAHPAFCCSRL